MGTLKIGSAKEKKGIKIIPNKVLFNGKLFIRTTMPDGKQVWYDVMGLKL